METDFEFKKYDFLWALFLFGLCILFYLVAFKPYSNEIQTKTVQLNYNLPNSNKGYDISKSDNTLTYSDKGHIKTINLDPSLDIDISYVSKGNAKK